jgi:DNA polymerase-3 subunit delta'
MFDDYYGNEAIQDQLAHMISGDKIPQTILLAGPEGVGKATLARRFAARLIGHPELIEKDDLNRDENLTIIAEREKLAADKRSEDPLLFASHTDFVTFPPEGPLRQLSIQQMRLLKERGQYKPDRGRYRVFLIDHIDRANEQAANSLLKTLEEPPEHLILIMTAENPYDLLPTIRSRAVQFLLGRLTDDAMRTFVTRRQLDRSERRVPLAAGSPGLAVSIDLDVYDKRRTAMLALLEVASGRAPFSAWVKYSESIGASKSEKLDQYLKVLYILLEDLLLLAHGQSVRNPDIRKQLEPLAATVAFQWIERAVQKVDDLAGLVRRNIQKSIALDALAIDLRNA